MDMCDHSYLVCILHQALRMMDVCTYRSTADGWYEQSWLSTMANLVSMLHLLNLLTF